MADRRPMAFMSYAHIDDRLNRGYLTEFCECLSDEVCLHLGEEFPIFMDRKDIKWGDSWKKRIEDSIDGTTFLIPIITPGFFKSQYCRDELTRFLEREGKLERDDLILPIYLIDTPLLDDKIKRNQDELAQTISPRQYADWRGLRFEDLGSGAARRALAELAAQIRDALDSIPPATKDNEPKVETPAPVHHETRPSTAASEKESERKKPGPEIPTVVVDQWHRGDFATITEAIAAATPGSKILVHSGVYDEGLIIDKPLEIIGDSNSGEVIIRADSRNAILFVTTRGKISNLILKQSGDSEWNCVDSSQGFLEIEHCDISSDSAACISIKGNAYSKIIRNKIHNGKGSGICVCENGQGLIESNDIYNNGSANVEIYGNGNPIVKSNCIFSGNGAGIYVHGDGKGVIEDNEIFENISACVEICENGNPIIKHNKIYNGKHAGIYIYNNGQGVIEDNDIYCNENSGIAIYSGGNAKVIRNKIHDGKSDGITLDNSKSVIEGNEIFQNNSCGIRMSNGGNPMIIRNKIHDGIKQGILVDKSLGAIEENDIFGNIDSGIGIYNGGSPVIKHNNIHNGKNSGVYVSGSKGIITDNEIYSNEHAGIRISFGGNPKVTHNRIKKNGFDGVWISSKSGGTFEYNDLRENQSGAWDISEDSESFVKRSVNQE